jgi:hypothetical protein
VPPLRKTNVVRSRRMSDDHVIPLFAEKPAHSSVPLACQPAVARSGGQERAAGWRLRLALDGREHDGIALPRCGRSNLSKGASPMDLVTLVTACALAVDPKLMHALVWHQSGGEPWAVSVQGERSPRVYAGMDDAIREARASPIGSVVRVGLAGLSVPPSRVTASVLLPCRNVAMAAAQIAKHASRCKTHPRLKTDPTFCAVAVYRGSWEQPDVNFATDVATSVAKGDAPNFDMPRGTSTEIFDTASDPPSDADTPVVAAAPAANERVRSWSSALFPARSNRLASESESSTPVRSPTVESPLPRMPAAPPTESNAQDRDLFVRRSGVGIP